MTRIKVGVDESIDEVVVREAEFLAAPMPALLTRISMRPNKEIAPSPILFPHSLRNVDLESCPAKLFSRVRDTFRPIDQKHLGAISMRCAAVAARTPLAAPVTIATRSANRGGRVNAASICRHHACHRILIVVRLIASASRRRWMPVAGGIPAALRPTSGTRLPFGSTRR